MTRLYSEGGLFSDGAWRQKGGGGENPVITPFATDEEAYRGANDSRYGLSVIADHSNAKLGLVALLP